MQETNTFRAFEERITSLEQQYIKLCNLKHEYEGTISDAYASLAANVLTTLAVVTKLFEIYRNEYNENEPNKKSYLGKDSSS